MTGLRWEKRVVCIRIAWSNTIDGDTRRHCLSRSFLPLLGSNPVRTKSLKPWNDPDRYRCLPVQSSRWEIRILVGLAFKLHTASLRGSQHHQVIVVVPTENLNSTLCPSFQAQRLSRADAPLSFHEATQVRALPLPLHPPPKLRGNASIDHSQALLPAPTFSVKMVILPTPRQSKPTHQCLFFFLRLSFE